MRHGFSVTVACICLGSVLGTTVGRAQDAVHFTVTADVRFEHAAFDEVLDAMNALVGGQGDFQISPGDMDDRVWENRTVLDGRMGPDAVWIPGVGNHEAEDAVEMEWVRAEYENGNGARPPLQSLVSRQGPEGSRETTFSWDRGNVHFVYINQYWDGSAGPGSDVATDGDVVPELLAWLEDDLRSNTRPAVFVFGHEPAYPFHRHVTDSLNKYQANRDAFWSLLERESVMAYICGHTHVYSTFRPEEGRVWQIDVGNAGNDSAFLDGQTFLSVTVDATHAYFAVCRNYDGPFSCDTAWSQPIPIIFKDAFEAGDTTVWSSSTP